MGRIIWAESLDNYTVIVSCGDKENYVNYEIINTSELSDEVLGIVKSHSSESKLYEKDIRTWEQIALAWIANR